MKKITVGVLAHVDAGKTTLCEAMLYLSKSINRLGRVDNKDTFLDTYFEERRRGITIFSKIARLEYKDSLITLVDTPGHADFSSEMERSLQILDYAVLIISATDSVQSHTYTLLKLLRKYHIPAFIFITKMDVAKLTKEQLISDIAVKTSVPCIDFTGGIDYESIAMTDDRLIEKYLEDGRLSVSDISLQIKDEKIYPCYLGSGLKLDGVVELLDGINLYACEPDYETDFSARVFKITRDDRGRRLTYIKMNGGTLSAKSVICDEKIDEIRLYSGPKYESVSTVYAGDVCALLGLNKTRPGMDLKSSNIVYSPLIESVLSYCVILPENVDAITVLPKFRELEEEDPSLHVGWDSENKKITVNLMGKIQIEVLTSIFKDRYDIDISFSTGSILYRETIASPVEGVGHYEPLKHYAEVHLLLEPLPEGSGILFDNALTNDDLDPNYQNLILSHLKEKTHIGVLTGSPITDIKITLIAGKAHLKHTEGGDFRQATYRAVRQGLMCAKSILLEPVYDFCIEIPSEHIGKVVSDLHLMEGNVNPIDTVNNYSVITGTAPVRTISDYYSQLISFTRGMGRIGLTPSGYIPCSNQQKTVENIGYNPKSDDANSPDSIFCSHGAGTNIPWNEVYNYCHLPLIKERNDEPSSQKIHHMINLDDDELDQIMNREFGPIRRKQYTQPTVIESKSVKAETKPTTIIIDGYNQIFSWKELKEIAADSIDSAREKLINKIINYQAFTGLEIILVFDAYLIQGGKGSKDTNSKMHVVYTQEGETADAYIEKLIGEIGKNIKVKVVSSDSLIQVSAIKSGVLRVSSREFESEVESVLKMIRDIIK